MCTTIAVYHVHKVQALPISLAATFGIISLFSFRLVTKMFQFTSFPPHNLCIQLWVLRFEPQRVSPFGILRIKASCQLPVDYRRHARPSSAASTKASTISSLQLYLIIVVNIAVVNYQVIIDDYAYIILITVLYINQYTLIILCSCQCTSALDIVSNQYLMSSIEA